MRPHSQQRATLPISKNQKHWKNVQSEIQLGPCKFMYHLKETEDRAVPGAVKEKGTRNEEQAQLCAFTTLLQGNELRQTRLKTSERLLDTKCSQHLTQKNSMLPPCSVPLQKRRVLACQSAHPLRQHGLSFVDSFRTASKPANSICSFHPIAIGVPKQM